MGIRYGEIKPDIRVLSLTPDADELLTVPLRRWRREPSIGDMVVVGDPDEVSLLFVNVASIEGEWPDGQAVLKSTGGPYLLGDNWCDLLDG